MRHLIQGEILHGSLGRSHVVLEVLLFHVGLPEFAGLPVFEKQEVRRVLVVLVHFVVDAAFLD